MKLALVAAAVFLAASTGFDARGEGPPSFLPQTRWNQLSPEAKEKALENYRTYRSLSPEERGRLDEGYQRWKKLSSDDKKKLRDRFRRYQQLSEEERERVRDRIKGKRRD